MRDFGSWFNDEAERLSETTIDPYAVPTPPRAATQPSRYIENDQHAILDDDGCVWHYNWDQNFLGLDEDDEFYGD